MSQDQNTALDKARINRRHIIGAGAVIAAASLADAAPVQAATPLIDIALGLIADWRERKIDAVLARVHPDIVWHYHVGAHPPIRGKAAMRTFLEAMLTRISDNRWRVFKHATNGDSVFMEGVDDFADAQGKRIPVLYMGIMTMKNGLITEWRDYFDGGTVDSLKRGEPLGEGIDVLLARPARP
jgi:limonene-1,2-epoxide hydrolase